MTKVAKGALQRLLSRCLRPATRVLARRVDLTYLAQQANEAKFFRAPPSRIAGILGGARLRIFDIGARGGIETGWERYRPCLDVTLAEPDPEEARRLGAAGFRVIQALIGDHEGTGILNLCEKGGANSLLQPDGPFLHYYTSGATARFRVVERIELPMTTVARVSETQGEPFDYIKLDTQGSETAILRAIGDWAPLIIKSEISFVPFYREQSLYFEVARLLWERGYVLFHMAFSTRNAPSAQRGPHPYRGIGLPIYGDAWFCPDWTRGAGRALFTGRERQYRALMEIFGLGAIADYAMTVSGSPGTSAPSPASSGDSSRYS